MKLKSFFLVNALMFIPFGTGMLLMPLFIFKMLDVNLDADGLLMASTVGSLLLSFGVLSYFSRNLDIYSAGVKAILIANLLFHIIDCFLTFKGTYTGVMNSFGYLFSTLHFLFALGFAYYLSIHIKSK